MLRRSAEHFTAEDAILSIPLRGDGCLPPQRPSAATSRSSDKDAAEVMVRGWGSVGGEKSGKFVDLGVVEDSAGAVKLMDVGESICAIVTHSGVVISTTTLPRWTLTPLSFPSAESPLQVTQVACGRHHCLALTRSGDVYSWGEGIGLGFADMSSVLLRSPRKVNFPRSKFNQLGVGMVPVHGRMHVELISAAEEQSAVVCNDHSGLGLREIVCLWGRLPFAIDEIEPRPYFVRCSPNALEGDRISEIALGNAFGLALCQSGFSLVAWGEPGSFIGGGGRRPPVRLPKAEDKKEGFGPEWTKVRLGTFEQHPFDALLVDVPASALPLKSIKAGAEHALLLSSAGAVHAFGSNLFGQCASPMHEEELFSPKRIQFGSGDDPPIMKSIHCGDYHSAAVSASNLVYVWGRRSACPSVGGREEHPRKIGIAVEPERQLCYFAARALAIPAPGPMKIALGAGRTLICIPEPGVAKSTPRE